MVDLIDKQALNKALGIDAVDCEKCSWGDKYGRCKRGADFEDACCAIYDAPTVEPEILSDFKSALFGIGEICVDVSKCNITAEEGIQQIRDKYLDVMYRKVVQNE